MEQHVFCIHIKGLDGRRLRRGHGAGNVSIFLAVASNMNALCSNSLNFNLLKRVQTWGDLALMAQLQIVGGIFLVCLFVYLHDQIYYICGSGDMHLMKSCVLNTIQHFSFFFSPEWAKRLHARILMLVAVVLKLQISMLWIYHLFSWTKQNAYSLSLVLHDIQPFTFAA